MLLTRDPVVQLRIGLRAYCDTLPIRLSNPEAICLVAFLLDLNEQLTTPFLAEHLAAEVGMSFEVTEHISRRARNEVVDLGWASAGRALGEGTGRGGYYLISLNPEARQDDLFRECCQAAARLIARWKRLS